MSKIPQPPSYNHTRGDSALYPCGECAEQRTVYLAWRQRNFEQAVEVATKKLRSMQATYRLRAGEMIKLLHMLAENWVFVLVDKERGDDE